MGQSESRFLLRPMRDGRRTNKWKTVQPDARLRHPAPPPLPFEMNPVATGKRTWQ
jgi:hypothetical protein